MVNTTTERIQEILASQKDFFGRGTTRDLKFRKQTLKRFLAVLQDNEKNLCDALWTDLHKSYEEAYITELSIVYSELKNHIRHICSWAKPHRKATPLKMFPSSSKVVAEPLGTALIIAPWNYPVQLLLNPLVGAISAGCTAVVKPSPYTPNVALALEKVIKETFNEEYVAVVQGNRDVNRVLLDNRFDIIFFTGSPALGKIVMSAAAKNLTPVVLELGGKSPCIVDKDCNLKVAARRIAWGKLLNAGQTCIAPDYLLLHKDIKEPFLQLLKAEFDSLTLGDAHSAKHFVRIVNDKAMQRLIGYLKCGKVIYGGEYDTADRYFAPTIIDNVSEESDLMQTEIFGPIFPVLTFENISEAITFVNKREKPLALYYFGGQGEKVIGSTSAGGSCVGDTIFHIANENIPFGGVGNSGMSAYHGKLSFDAFTHYRSVVTTPMWIDIPLRYMPYSLFKLIKPLL